MLFFQKTKLYLKNIHRVTHSPVLSEKGYKAKLLFGYFAASSKVVYTDYQYAVVMNCEEILPNGNCGKRR